MSTEREKLEKHINAWASASGSERLREGGAMLAKLLDEYRDAEVRLALAPKAPSPKLAESEIILRSTDPTYPMYVGQRRIIANELDRLRAENARLEAEKELLRAAMRTVDRHVLGCLDNSCLFVEHKGVGTNGGCRCITKDKARPFEVQALAALVKTARAIVAERADKEGK